MSALPFVVAFAAVWHVTLAVAVHYRAPKSNRPPLKKLLLMAEVEALQTIKNELARRVSKGREKAEKLEYVERRLKEIEGKQV